MVAMTLRQLVGLLSAVFLVAQGVAFLIALSPLVPAHTVLYLDWAEVAFGVYVFVYNWRQVYWRKA